MLFSAHPNIHYRTSFFNKLALHLAEISACEEIFEEKTKNLRHF